MKKLLTLVAVFGMIASIGCNNPSSTTKKADTPTKAADTPTKAS